MLFILFILFLSCIANVTSINYLTQTQWNHIKHILQHPKSTSTMINICNEIIFQHYKHYAYNMAYDFKTTYYKKCRHIPLNELKLYASRGLLNAILRYNSSLPVSFSKYASIYIKGELYYGMSEMHPLTLLPISKRIHKQWRTQNLVLYKKMTNTKFMSNYDYYDGLYVSTHKDSYIWVDKYKELQELWNIINRLDEEDNKIIKYKYNFYFQKIRSDKEIGDLLGYSSETIRKKINKIKSRVYNETRNNN
uniref:Uncharacterized protein n=1 Tax=viral metagenome TaxID=1070528 RepID=A0A6C0CU98_9ZZZZ